MFAIIGQKTKLAEWILFCQNFWVSIHHESRMNCGVDPFLNKMCSKAKVWEFRTTFCPLFTPRLDRNPLWSTHLQISSSLFAFRKSPVAQDLGAEYSSTQNVYWISIPISRFDPFNFNMYETGSWYFIDLPTSKARKVTLNHTCMGERIPLTRETLQCGFTSFHWNLESSLSNSYKSHTQ